MKKTLSNKFLTIIRSLDKEKLALILVLIFSFSFSWFLMAKTLSYKDDTLLISYKIRSDFKANIPLIRSFSLGDNIPPQYPLFAGPRIRYHFLFYMLTGLLEKAGLRIDLALNLLSTIGFSGLLIGVYWLTKKLSKSILGGAIAILLLIFNSSFSWIYYFFIDKLDFTSLTDIINNSKFASFGPYDDHIISAFWSLNIFTNQRHFAFAFALFFIAIWAVIYSKKKSTLLLAVFIMGVLPWLHKAMLLNLLLIFGLSVLLNSKGRLRSLLALLFGGLLAIPGVYYLNTQGFIGNQGISVRPGFIYNGTSWRDFSYITKPFTRWLFYWFMNLGILPLISFYGWLVVTKPKPKSKGLRKFLTKFFSRESIWFFAAWIMFAIANYFSFASDHATNHKLINFTIILLSLYAASFIATLARSRLGKFVAVIVFVFLTFGGILDLFPVINGDLSRWEDVNLNPISNWIVKNTPKDSVILNATYDTENLTITGRKIYFGWDYFSWSIGYNTNSRRGVMMNIFEEKENLSNLCQLLTKEGIDYIFLDHEPHGNFSVELNNLDFIDEKFRQTKTSFERYSIYEVNPPCQDELLL